MVFVLDSSGSVGHTDFEVALQFLHGLIESLDVGAGKTQTALLTFATNNVVSATFLCFVLIAWFYLELVRVRTVAVRL